MKILVKCHQATASGLPLCDIFAPQKVPFLKISDDVIACDLWFGPPPIKNPGYAYALEEPLARVDVIRFGACSASLGVQIDSPRVRTCVSQSLTGAVIRNPKGF